MTRSCAPANGPATSATAPKKPPTRVPATIRPVWPRLPSWCWFAVAVAGGAGAARTRGFESEGDRVMERAMSASHGIARRERRHVEIVALVLAGDIDRARALGAAHLQEFRDPLIDHLLAPPRTK